MMPMPPSSATAMAIAARVTVSMLAETIGRLRVIAVDSRPRRSIRSGSRRSSTLHCGASRKSSNVAPWTSARSASPWFTGGGRPGTGRACYAAREAVAIPAMTGFATRMYSAPEIRISSPWLPAGTTISPASASVRSRKTSTP